MSGIEHLVRKTYSSGTSALINLRHVSISDADGGDGDGDDEDGDGDDEC